MTTNDTSITPSSPTILHQLRLIFDQQGRTHGVAQETLERLLPLAQLLDLLNRPEDQAQDLGRELSETLKEIAAQMRSMRQAMITGQEQGTRIEDTLTAMLAQQAEIMKDMELLRAATRRSQAGIVELQDGLLEKATD
ncbi:hypothetical protein [Paracoccus actinidiae]|uniref:hypothetical protein n=1 Tax=Paracoccus actinidiae TaxID=3064531 RepID=UPI0027D2AC26|nr:hypothetical protein [Paracoccus sp. M09]